MFQCKNRYFAVEKNIKLPLADWKKPITPWGTPLQIYMECETAELRINELAISSYK